MTAREVIKILKNNYPKTCRMVNGRYQGGFDDTESDFGQALTMAISALEEIQQYREIGTVEECREAVEKQRAKKPKFLYMLNDTKYTAECKCGHRFTADIDCRYNPQFCSKCGVKFDWSEDSEGNGT